MQYWIILFISLWALLMAQLQKLVQYYDRKKIYHRIKFYSNTHYFKSSNKRFPIQCPEIKPLNLKKVEVKKETKIM